MICNIVYRQNRFRAVEKRVVSFGGFQIRRQKSRLPIIGMDDIRTEAYSLKDLKDGACEESKASVIIGVVFAKARIDIIRFPLEQGRAIDKER